MNEVGQERQAMASESERIAGALVAAVERRGGEDVRILDVSALVSYTDLILICTARNERMADAIADEARMALKGSMGLLPSGTEGSATAGWQVVDYLDCVLHIFTPEGRERFQLEHLWKDAPERSIEPSH